MENNYNNNEVGENSGGQRGYFIYGGSQVPVGGWGVGGRSSGGGGDCYDPMIVKTEGGSTSQHHHDHTFHYPSIIRHHHQTVQNHHQESTETSPSAPTGEVLEALKAKIIAHPQCSNLLDAYMDCQKVYTFYLFEPIFVQSQT